MGGKKLGITPTVEEDVVLNNVQLCAYTEIQAHSVLNNCQLGDYSYCAGYNQIDYASIGKFCSIASFVRINPGNHPSYSRVAQHHFSYRSAQYGFGEDDADFFAWRKDNWVSIGNDVWIGHGATIMAGVKIGDGAVIGAGTIVTKDVDDYSVVAGVPAKKIKSRFEDETVKKIKELRWWDWSHEIIKERIPDFRDIAVFLRKYL